MLRHVVCDAHVYTCNILMYIPVCRWEGLSLISVSVTRECFDNVHTFYISCWL